MEVILTNDSIAQVDQNTVVTPEKSIFNKGGKFEFIKGCWFIAKKLFLLG